MHRGEQPAAAGCARHRCCLWRAAGPELHEVGLLCGPHAIRAPLPAIAAGTCRWGRALGREHLDALLLERARELGAAVLQPCSALSIRDGTGGSLCEVLTQDSTSGAAGESAILRAPIVIDAHGSWQRLHTERVRERRRLSAGDLLAFKANFTHTALQPGVLPVLCFRGGYGGMVVADHATTTLACCIRAGRLQACRRRAPGRRAGEVVEAYLRDQCSGVRDALEGAERAGPWLAAGPLRPGIRVSQGEAVFVTGNAAGEVHPIIGEGISMAIQSAWLLCEQLRRERSVLGCGGAARRCRRLIHQRYAGQWRAHFGMRLRLASCFAQAAMQPALWRGGLALLHRSPHWLTRAARWSGKIQCAIHP
jgi:menaquinone-9 beta-reductase